MSDAQNFSFGDDSVALSYDHVLVPLLFEPWARRLVAEHAPWQGRTVLDLATGTGIVARLLADQVGPDGRVIGLDINSAMLEQARLRCADANAPVEFSVSPASPLELPDKAVDVVVCQQGFQFFPDRHEAASEVLRVLRPGGKVIATTWRPVAECEYFGKICEALEAVGEPSIADMMRVPFDFLPEAELISPFDDSGFVQVEVRQQSLDMVFDRGLEQTVDVVHATPIAPKLAALPDDKQRRFEQTLIQLCQGMTDNGTPSGRMVTNVLIASKPI